MDAQRHGGSAIATIFSFYPNKSLKLTRSLRDLLDRMLVFEPRRRANLAEVAGSEWLAVHLPQSSACVAELRLSCCDQSGATSVSSGGSGGAIGSNANAADVSSLSRPLTGDMAVSSEVKADRQDSSSTLHSIASSVGSSVVASNARLRCLEGVLCSEHRSSAVDTLPPVQYAIAGGTKQATVSASAHPSASGRSKSHARAVLDILRNHHHPELQHISSLLAKAAMTRVIVAGNTTSPLSCTRPPTNEP